jgi:hypothetical protein
MTVDNELPDNAVNPYAPAGTPPARVAHFAPFWCIHGVKHEYDNKEGKFFVDGNAPDDDLHPKDVGYVGNGALDVLCQPASGVDPVKHPNAGPAAVQRAYLEVLRERRDRGRH